MYEETSNHYFIVFSLYVLCCILFSTFSYCRNCGVSTHQLLFQGRVKLSIQTVKSCLSYVDERKYSSVSHQLKIIEDKHQSSKQEIRFGKKGKTAQFWMSYLDIMEQQHYLHVDIQQNSFAACMNAWEYFLPFYFVMNKLNYAKYGSYCLHQMKDREVIYPGLKVPVSVRGQNWYNIWIHIDQWGE